MKTKILFLIGLVFIIPKINAQTPDEESIQQTVRMETEAAMNGDTIAWKNFYVQDEKTTITYTGNGYNIILLVGKA